MTYFDHLRRRWKDENDEERSKRRAAWSKQSKRDQRVRLVNKIIPYIGIVIFHLQLTQLQKRLTKEAVLDHINICIEKAALRLDLPKVQIIEEDIPQDALSDLESDPEEVPLQEKARYAKEAGLERVSSKWMSRRKVWTSEEVGHCSYNRHRCKDLHSVLQFEALKDLVKFVMNSQEVSRASAISKKAPATPQYRGALTFRQPVSMKNIQDWMVDLSILQDNITTCKRNRDPPFTLEAISNLKVLLDTALEICSGGGGDETDATEPETQ